MGSRETDRHSRTGYITNQRLALRMVATVVGHHEPTLATVKLGLDGSRDPARHTV